MTRATAICNARILVSLIAALSMCRMAAQSPTPSPQPGASIPAKVPVDSLAPEEIEQAIRLLKANFVDPNAFREGEISRATLEGLLQRLHGGAILLASNSGKAAPVPFYSEILGNHIGYLRIGSLAPDNLREMDKALATFASKKVDSIAIDLRASPAGNDFTIAAEVIKRFVPKGKTLWTIHKNSPRQDHAFVNERDPSFQGIIMVLVDSETLGPTEAMAAALRIDAHALLIGQTTAGRAVEYSDFPLSGGKILQVAIGETISADGHTLFPNGVVPELAVETPIDQKRQIFAASIERGMAPFVFEPERPHFNEASLMAGSNPEAEPRSQRHNAQEGLHDAVLQRAVDVIASVAIFQRR